MVYATEDNFLVREYGIGTIFCQKNGGIALILPAMYVSINVPESKLSTNLLSPVGRIDFRAHCDERLARNCGLSNRSALPGSARLEEYNAKRT